MEIFSIIIPEVFSKLISKWCEDYSDSGRSLKKPQILYVFVAFLRGIHGIYALVRKSEQHEGRGFEKTSLVFLAALLTFGCAGVGRGTAYAGPVKMFRCSLLDRNHTEIEVRLEPASCDYPFPVRLHVRNVSDNALAIPKFCFDIFHDYHNVLVFDCFSIRNEDGLSPDYCGILMKLKTYGLMLSDCRILEPGASVVIDVPGLAGSYYIDGLKYRELRTRYSHFLGVSNEIVLVAPESD